MNNTFSSKELLLLHIFYPLYFIVCYLQARGIVPPYLPDEGIAMWPFRLFILYMGIKAYIKNHNKCSILSVYVIYSLLSFVLYAFQDYPLELYVNDVAFYLLPLFAFYIGADDTDTSDTFYKYTLGAIIVMFVIGMYLYIYNPTWYQNAWVLNYNSRWQKEGLNVDFEYIAANMRFSSFMVSSYATEYFGLFALPFSLCYMIKENNKKRRNRLMLISVFIIVVIVLSMQRAAIGASIAMLIIFGIYDLNHSKRAFKFFVVLICVGIVLFIYFAASEVGQRVIERLGEFGIKDTFSETRTSQNENLLNAWNNIVVGNGLGTGGNQARRLGLPAVTDSNYVKILVEQGLVGIMMFVIFLLSTCKRVLCNFKYLAAEGAMLASIMVTMIGSNSLLFSLYIVPFWFCCGRIWNDAYIQRLKENKINI